MDSEPLSSFSPEKQLQTCQCPDSHLLSTLGVTTANPEDIERDLIAATAQTDRGHNESVAVVQKDEGIQRDGADDQDASMRQELRILNRLHALDREINAVAAGLDSLPQETLEREESDGATEDEEEAREHLHGKRQSENSRDVDGLHLQRVLGEERLTSLREKRRLLEDQLSALGPRRDDPRVNGSFPDDNAPDKRAVATSSRRAGTLTGKLGNQRQRNTVSFDDDEFDAALDAASRIVETERDRLIRTGVLTPFDRLKGFERRVETASSGHLRTQQVESSLANVAASMAAQAKSRPTTKLLDASQLPKLAPPTREFIRLRRKQKSGGTRDKSEKTPNDRAAKEKKRRRPMPEMKWRKRHRSDREISVQEEQSEGTGCGERFPFFKIYSCAH